MYENVLRHQRKLRKQKMFLEKALSELPLGKLGIAKNGNIYKWYKSDEGLREYIPKKNREMAEKLASKKYYTWVLEDVEKELCAIEAYLKKYTPSEKLKGLFDNASEFRRLLSERLRPEKDDLLVWTREKYERNTSFSRGACS